MNFINPAGLALLGFEAVELIGQKIHPLIHHTRPDGSLSGRGVPDAPQPDPGYDRQPGRRGPLAKRCTSFPVEYTSVRSARMVPLPALWSFFAILANAKRPRKRCVTSKAAARGLLDATQESLLLLDKEGTIIASNQTAAQRLKKSSDEL